MTFLATHGISNMHTQYQSDVNLLVKLTYAISQDLKGVTVNIHAPRHIVKAPLEVLCRDHLFISILT
jgi:hypothetical protein